MEARCVEQEKPESYYSPPLKSVAESAQYDEKTGTVHILAESTWDLSLCFVPSYALRLLDILAKETDSLPTAVISLTIEGTRSCPDNGRVTQYSPDFETAYIHDTSIKKDDDPVDNAYVPKIRLRKKSAPPDRDISLCRESISASQGGNPSGCDAQKDTDVYNSNEIRDEEREIFDGNFARVIGRRANTRSAENIQTSDPPECPIACGDEPEYDDDEDIHADPNQHVALRRIREGASGMMEDVTTVIQNACDGERYRIFIASKRGIATWQMEKPKLIGWLPPLQLREKNCLIFQALRFFDRLFPARLVIAMSMNVWVECWAGRNGTGIGYMVQKLPAVFLLSTQSGVVLPILQASMYVCL